MRPRLRRVSEPDPFPGVDQPGDLRNAAGTWLAERLADFDWLKSSGEVRRKRGGRSDKIVLQGSKWNLSGAVASFSVYAVVFDSGLARWRKKYQDRVTLNTPFVGRLYPAHDLDLHEPRGRSSALRATLDWIERAALPFFDLTSDAERVANGDADEWTKSHQAATVEWLLWQEPDLAQQFLDRLLHNQSPEWMKRFSNGYAVGEKQEPLSQHGDGAVELGWLAAQQGLAARRGPDQ